MPTHEEHCKESLKKYGKTFSDLHHWMDEPSTLLGKGHRIYRHDPIRTPSLAKKLFGELAEQACIDHIRLDELESRRMQVQQPLELTDQTEWLINFTYPSLEEIHTKPKTSEGILNIEFRRILVYYNATDSFNARKNVVGKLAECAIEKYGRKNVNTRIAEDGNFKTFMNFSLNRKRIQIFFADQFSSHFLKTQDGRKHEWQSEFLSLSDKWAEKTGRRNGLIVVFFAVHTLNVPYEVMYDCSAIVFRNSPATRQDHTEMKDLIGEEAILYLKELEQDRKKDTNLLKRSLFWTKEKIGILETIPPKKDYWKPAFDIEEVIKRGVSHSRKDVWR